MQSFSLSAKSELRVISRKGFNLRLISGCGEMFGKELALNRTYDFGEMSQLSVCTFHGCEIQLDGLDPNIDDAYIAHDIEPLKAYMKLHRKLHNVRNSSGLGLMGPRVVILGPSGSGKTSLWKILRNWACRLGNRPVAIDLDVSHNDLGLPGAISAADTSFDCDEQLISIHYGNLHPSDNQELYEHIVLRLAMTMKVRMDSCAETRVSGLLVNTFGWIEGKGYSMQLRTCKDFSADHVVVIGDDRLYSRLKKDLNPDVYIIQVPRSSGACPLSKEKILSIRNQRIKEYFYGTEKSPLFPHRQSLKLVWSRKEENAVNLYQIGHTPRVPDGCIPFDVQYVQTISYKCVTEYRKCITLLKNRLIAVSCGEAPTDCPEENIYGYVLVEDTIGTNVINVLCPAPNIPNNILIVSDVKYTGECMEDRKMVNKEV